MDFSKAFDTIMSWIKLNAHNLLTVVVDGTGFSPVSGLSGVPEGTVLGP